MSTMTSQALIWRCEMCAEPVADGDGFVYLLHRKRREAVEHGEVAAWCVYHRACDPNPDDLAYSITVERIRTREHAEDWTRHLRMKNWFAFTNWYALLRRGAPS